MARLDAVEDEGSNRPRSFRPFGEGFWPDVAWALAVLAGAALGALVFDAFDVLAGAVVGVIVLVIARAVRRGVKRHGAPDPGAER
jgi:hypothetical protein